MKRRKTKYYKHREKFPRKKKIYRRNKKKRNITDYQCSFCKGKGHLANQCPKKFNNKRFEVDDAIENLINNNELNRFVEIKEISSNESIFIFTDIDYERSGEDE